MLGAKKMTHSCSPWPAWPMRRSRLSTSTRRPLDGGARARGRRIGLDRHAMAGGRAGLGALGLRASLSGSRRLRSARAPNLRQPAGGHGRYRPHRRAAGVEPHGGAADAECDVVLTPLEPDFLGMQGFNRLLHTMKKHGVPWSRLRSSSAATSIGSPSIARCGSGWDSYSETERCCRWSSAIRCAWPRRPVLGALRSRAQQLGRRRLRGGGAAAVAGMANGDERSADGCPERASGDGGVG